MLFYLLCYYVLSGTAAGFPENILISENVPVPSKVEGRIVGGDLPDDYDNFSYQVQMVVKARRFCSGTIIDKYHIVTSAHCVDDVMPKDLEVRAGSRTRGEGMLVPIASIRLPEEYDTSELDMDVAVMRTVNPFTFSTDFTSASLAAGNSDLPNTVTVSGWGSDRTTDLTDELMYVDLPLISNILCQARYPEVSITKNMFCAENTRTGDQGTCKGDGGDPATIEDSPELVGISIFTLGCGIGVAPSVFTNVKARQIRDFINNNTKDQGSSPGGNHHGGNHNGGNHNGGNNGGNHNGGNHNGGDNDASNHDGGNNDGNNQGSDNDSGNQNGGNPGGSNHEGGENDGSNHDGGNNDGSNHDGGNNDIGNQHDGDNNNCNCTI